MTDIEPYDSNVPARRDDVVLPGTAERIRAAIPPNTTRSYRETWARFAQWCQDNQRSSLPTSGVVLADYVAHLCDLGRAPSTIAHAMGVISAMNQVAGYPQLTKEVTKPANVILTGHRRIRAATGKRAKKAPPVTRERLAMMTAACDPATLTGKRDRLALVIGWALAGRRSEIAALQMEDVLIGDGDLDVLIRASKTDQNAEGVLVNIPAGEHSDTDPVGLLRDWLAALRERGVDTSTGSLLRAVTQYDRLYRRSGLTGEAIHGIVKRAAVRAKLPNAQDYSGHSLRAGFATTAATAGVPQAIWATHGRWSPTSPVPAGYVRLADARRNNPLRTMGL